MMFSILDIPERKHGCRGLENVCKESVVPSVTQQPDEDPLNLQAQRIIPNSTKQQQEESTKRKQTTLTRFGLNAYVLGAIRERFNCFGRRLQF